MAAARYMPELEFTSMIYIAERYVQIPPTNWTIRCVQPNCETMLWLRRYWCDFAELKIYNRGRAALCPDCLTLYYTDEPVRVSRVIGG